MPDAEWANVVTAIGTIGAAGAALWAAWTAARQVQVAREAIADQHRLLTEDLKVRAALEYEGKFDAPEMRRARVQLAKLLLYNQIAEPGVALTDDLHDRIRGDVPSFFESVGTLLNRSYFDRELAYAFFYQYVTYYWVALAKFIDYDHAKFGEDVWSGFKVFVNEVAKVYREKEKAEPPVLSVSDIERFLKMEASRTSD